MIMIMMICTGWQHCFSQGKSRVHSMLNNFPIHVESPVCHAEDCFLPMHVTQRYQGHTMIQPWETTWTIFFRSRCANGIYIPWGDFWILWGDFLVAVCHAVGCLIALWGTKGRTLVPEFWSNTPRSDTKRSMPYVVTSYQKTNNENQHVQNEPLDSTQSWSNPAGVPTLLS